MKHDAYLPTRRDYAEGRVMSTQSDIAAVVSAIGGSTNRTCGSGVT
jgi:hypothetical protein